MILYLETSNLVKLYVKEAGSEEIKKIITESDVAATSVVSYVEARAAFARKLRAGELTAGDHGKIKADLDRDWYSFFVLNLTDGLVRAAAEVAEKHGLRAYAAVHLAAAIELKAAVLPTTSIIFLSADDRLREAARQEGLG